MTVSADRDVLPSPYQPQNAAWERGRMCLGARLSRVRDLASAPEGGFPLRCGAGAAVRDRLAPRFNRVGRAAGFQAIFGSSALQSSISCHTKSGFYQAPDGTATIAFTNGQSLTAVPLPVDISRFNVALQALPTVADIRGHLDGTVTFTQGGRVRRLRPAFQVTPSPAEAKRAALTPQPDGSFLFDFDTGEGRRQRFLPAL